MLTSLRIIRHAIVVPLSLIPSKEMHGRVLLLFDRFWFSFFWVMLTIMSLRLFVRRIWIIGTSSSIKGPSRPKRICTLSWSKFIALAWSISYRFLGPMRVQNWKNTRGWYLTIVGFSGSWKMDLWQASSSPASLGRFQNRWLLSTLPRYRTLLTSYLTYSYHRRTFLFGRAKVECMEDVIYSPGKLSKHNLCFVGSGRTGLSARTGSHPQRYQGR